MAQYFKWLATYSLLLSYNLHFHICRSSNSAAGAAATSIFHRQAVNKRTSIFSLATTLVKASTSRSLTIDPTILESEQKIRKEKNQSIIFLQLQVCN